MRIETPATQRICRRCTWRVQLMILMRAAVTTWFTRDLLFCIRATLLLNFSIILTIGCDTPGHHARTVSESMTTPYPNTAVPDSRPVSTTASHAFWTTGLATPQMAQCGRHERVQKRHQSLLQLDGVYMIRAERKHGCSNGWRVLQSCQASTIAAKSVVGEIRNVWGLGCTAVI